MQTNNRIYLLNRSKKLAKKHNSKLNNLNYKHNYYHNTNKIMRISP